MQITACGTLVATALIASALSAHAKGTGVSHRKEFETAIASPELDHGPHPFTEHGAVEG
jgi:hypothetical protein